MTASTFTTGIQLRRVRQLNKQYIEVMGDTEMTFYNTQQKQYLKENKFTLASDLADLDRLLFFELLVFRWTQWLASGRDYDGLLQGTDEEKLRRNLKETAPLISAIKNDLGLTKSQRDKEQADSVGAYLLELKRRAKEHGVNREKQMARGISLCKELFSLIGTYDRSNPLERSKIGLDGPEDILDWIRTHMKPEFDEVDAHYRTSSQKYWVGRL